MTKQAILDLVDYAYGFGYDAFQGTDADEWRDEHQAVLKWIKEHTTDG